MFEERKLRVDLLALVLLGLVVFLSVALLTYSPADKPGEMVYPLSRLYSSDALVYPPSEQITNSAGGWGALAADISFQSLGVGAYYLLISLAILDGWLLLRRPVASPVLRAIGWFVSLLGITAIATMIAPHASPGPVIGSGGYLGAMARTLLMAHFATAGGLILATCLTLVGLLLCTDYVLPRIAIFVVTLTFGLVMSLGQSIAAWRTGGSEEDEEEEEEFATDDLEPAVRIRGRLVDEVVEEEEDEEEESEYEEEEEAEEDEQEDVDEAPTPRQPSKRGGKKAGKRRLPSLRIRRPSERKEEREEIQHQLEEASRIDGRADYELPSIDLLLESDDVAYEEQEKEVRRKAKILEKTFANFGFQVKVVEIETGPVIAQYEVELEAGLRLSRITGLADDLAIALRVPSVRIVAPIPGKNTVGIEVPNETRQIVRLREVIEETNGRVSKMKIPIFLGKDVSGNPMTVDLATLPHLLIAGRTGTGKSVCLNAIINSILMTRTPDELRMLMIDPKMVELSGYRSLPHLMHPVVTDMRKAEAILEWAVQKMEERYELLARAGVRHLSMYNQLGEEELMERIRPQTEEEQKGIPLHLPYIVIVADEIADLMMTSGKEVEQHIIRLAQKSRAVGIHLILATQKPTVDVITGLIKSNLPARIAFQVASRTDSRVVLDEMGADKLLGNGDMLFLWPGTSTLLRGQGTYVSDDEINRVVESVSTGEQNFVTELVQLKVDEEEDGKLGALRKRDELYEAAVDVVVREQRGSVSLLQRTLGVGYGRAARLIDFMAEDGIVGQYAGSQAREVQLTLGDWERMQAGEEEAPEEAAEETAPAPVARRRKNRIVVDETWEEEDDELEEEDEESFGEDEDYEEEEDDEHEEDEYEEEEGESDEEEEDEDEEDEYEEEYEAESA